MTRIETTGTVLESRHTATKPRFTHKTEDTTAIVSSKLERGTQALLDGTPCCYMTSNGVIVQQFIISSIPGETAHAFHAFHAFAVCMQMPASTLLQGKNSQKFKTPQTPRSTDKPIHWTLQAPSHGTSLRYFAGWHVAEATPKAVHPSRLAGREFTDAGTARHLMLAPRILTIKRRKEGKTYSAE